MNIYIVHGYMANTQSHWFSWIKKQLPNDEVFIIPLPNSQNPILSKWIKAIDEHIDNLDQNSIIIAHSLGCFTTLRYLAQKSFSNLLAFIAVAGFQEQLVTLPELDLFLQDSINFDIIKDKIAHKFVIASESDKIVPIHYSKKLSQSLNATFISEENAGHFMASDGYTTFPTLLDIVQKVRSLKD